jgi:hypothetical protein
MAPCPLFARCAFRLAFMTAEKLGSLIGAIFGLIFVLANSGALPLEIGMVLRILGVAAFIAVLIALRRPRRPAAVARPAGSGFGRGYWLVVAGEVLAIAVGLALLNGPLHAPQAAVAWISFVVGAHFVGLAVVWKQPFFHWLGASILLCGSIGLALAVAASSESAVDTVGGVLPGALLLAFSLWGSTRVAGSDAARTTTP